MSGERFRVTNCTGFQIRPDSDPASSQTRRPMSSAWQVLDSGDCYRLLAEWSPSGGRKSGHYCESRAREYASALNAWDDGGCNGPAPRIDHRPPSKRPGFVRARDRR